MAEGWIYILTNPNCPPDLLRVGATTQSPEEEAQDLSRKTHLPTPFEVGFRVKVQNTGRAEKLVLKVLEKYHLQHDVGFFKINLENAIQMVEEAASYFKIDPKEEAPTEFVKTIRKQKTEGGDGSTGLEKVRCPGCDREFYIPGNQDLPTVSCPYCREAVGAGEKTGIATAEKQPIKDIDKLLGEVKPSPRKLDSKSQTITIRPAVPTGQPEPQKSKQPAPRSTRLGVLLAILILALAAAGIAFLPGWITTHVTTPTSPGEHGPDMPAPPEPPSPVEPSPEAATPSDITAGPGVKPGPAGESAISTSPPSSGESTVPDLKNPQTATALVFKDATVHVILAKPVSENTMFYRLPAGELANTDPALIVAAILGSGDIVPLRDTGRTNNQIFFRIDQDGLSKNGRLNIKTVILNGGSAIPCEEAWIRKEVLYYEHNQGVIGLPVDSVDVVYYRSDNGAVGVPVKVNGLMRLSALKRLVSGVRP